MWCVVTIYVPNVNPKLFAKFRKSIPPAWRAVCKSHDNGYVRFRCSSDKADALGWMTPERMEQIESMLMLMCKII